MRRQHRGGSTRGVGGQGVREVRLSPSRDFPEAFDPQSRETRTASPSYPGDNPGLSLCQAEQVEWGVVHRTPGRLALPCVLALVMSTPSSGFRSAQRARVPPVAEERGLAGITALHADD
jgi:hypothetical protein